MDYRGKSINQEHNRNLLYTCNKKRCAIENKRQRQQYDRNNCVVSYWQNMSFILKHWLSVSFKSSCHNLFWLSSLADHTTQWLVTKKHSSTSIKPPPHYFNHNNKIIETIGEAPYPCHRYSSFPNSCQTQPARHRSVAFRYDSMVMPNSGGNISKSIKLCCSLPTVGRKNEETAKKLKTS